MAPFYYLLAFCVLEGYIVIISFDLSEMGTSGYFIKKIISYKKNGAAIYIHALDTMCLTASFLLA